MAHRYWLGCWLAVLVLASAPPVGAAERVLHITVEADAAPWSRPDGSGYANDVVRAAYAAVGVRVVFDVVPYARCKREVIEGRSPACFSMSPAPELADAVRFSRLPLFTCRADYFQHRARPLSASSEAGMASGLVVGVVTGYEYPPSLAALRARGVRFEEARSEEANLRKLAQGRLDAVLINHNAVKSVQRMLQDVGVAGQVQYAFASGELASYIGFSRYTAEGEQARRLFDEGFAAITANGELAAIERRWQVQVGGSTGR